MNAHELNQRLCDQIDAVLTHLFPAGKKVRGEYCVGSLAGEAGESLKIHLGGVKKGFWADFQSEARGRTLVGLWCEAVCGGDYAKAAQEAKRFLGIVDNYDRNFRRPGIAPKKENPPALDRSRIRALVEDGVPMRYLVEERKIEPGVLLAYSVAESTEGDAVVFPFFPTVDGEEATTIGPKAHFVKFMKIERPTGKKEIWTSPAGVTDCLFGKNAKMPRTVPRGVLVITEGEIDALSVASYGYHAVSVPRGAKAATSDGRSANEQWIDADFAWLKDFERIYLWMDNDEPGRAAAADIAQRIGLERCFIVETPGGFKDANECRVSGMSAETVALALEAAKTMDPANLVWAGEFAEKVFQRLFPPGGVEPGHEFLWPFPWKIRLGEMTVWTGFSGHGKTVLLNQLAVHLADLGEKVCVASMEVEPDRTIETLWCQANGGRLPFTKAETEFLSEEAVMALARQRFNERYEWLAERFLLFVPEVDGSGVGRADWRKLVECFVYARQRYGCTTFIVDSLMMCVGRSEKEYQEVELFVNALAGLAKRHQVHVHLVAHSRKKDDESKPPGKQDVAGPKETADIAHNVAVVQRNIGKSKKENQLERELMELSAKVNGPDGAGLQQTIDEKTVELKVVRSWHDGELHLLKQRNGDGQLGSKYLYFLPGARQFVLSSPLAATRSHDSYAKRYFPVSDDGQKPR